MVATAVAILLAGWLIMGGHLLSPDFNCFVFTLVALHPFKQDDLSRAPLRIDWGRPLVAG